MVIIIRDIFLISFLLLMIFTTAKSKIFFIKIKDNTIIGYLAITLDLYSTSLIHYIPKETIPSQLHKKTLLALHF